MPESPPSANRWSIASHIRRWHAGQLVIVCILLLLAAAYTVYSHIETRRRIERSWQVNVVDLTEMQRRTTDMLRGMGAAGTQSATELDREFTARYPLIIAEHDSLAAEQRHFGKLWLAAGASLLLLLLTVCWIWFGGRRHASTA